MVVLFCPNCEGLLEKRRFGYICRNCKAVFTNNGGKEEKCDRSTIHESICNELMYMYKAKNADYGDSFHKTYLEEGMAMVRIRLSDKLNRFKILSTGKDAKVHNESMRDTLLDLANYSIMAIMELDENKEEK